ncbi:TIGR03747 family integrating conjugative element membrane protein [Cupriavidus pauculus]
MNPAENLDDLSPQQLRELAATLRAQIQEQDAVIARHAQELRYRQTKIDQLTHELAIHKRWKFGKRSEQLTSAQASLLEEAYLIASVYTVLTFLVRFFVLMLTLPLFLLAAFVGFVDGLARRDVRRFGAGRESGFIYHRAKASLMPLAVLPWVVYLALPVSVHPLLILLPAAALLGIATDIAAATFKKYL